MCGIVGIIADSPIVDRELLVRMRDSMTHRGPDDCGAWWSTDGRIGLAHRRLAIVDLSPGGRQPMASDDGQMHIVFNGELYNHAELRQRLAADDVRFRTQSDTEVLLAAMRRWGTDSLEKCNGMFAFGLHDADRKWITLARDRAGEKPLFYYARPGLFLFASELKALLAHPECPRKLDLESLDHYLAFGYVPGAKCLLCDVKKLPAGHRLDLDLSTGRHSVRAYWNLPARPESPSGDPVELAARLEELLEDAVRMQLQADVPVGILLSGGTDSSLVTALAARLAGSKVKTFNVAFPGYGHYDESRHARRIAEHFSTEHTELTVEPGSTELLPRLAAQFDEPLADSSMVPTYLVSRAIRQHATVALGGDGGDELFGGYSHYQRLLRLQRQRRFVPAAFRSWLGVAITHAVPVGVRGRNYALALMSDEVNSLSRLNVYFDAPTRRRLLEPLADHYDFAAALPEREKVCAAGEGSLLRRATELDFKTYLADDILVKVDRASMLTSLEIRAPFLDHRIVEFAFSQVPDRLRATTNRKKILLQLLAKRILPDDFDVARKQGFSIPLERWFRGEWGTFFEEVLREADSRIFNRVVMGRLLAAAQRGRHVQHQLFSLTMFELWRRSYRVEL